MNTINEQNQKRSILKSLAIVGFIGLIIVIAWLGIQLVKVLPSAFSSLASLADSVYQFDNDKFATSVNKTMVNTNESATISWNVPKRTGTFAFSYECVEGLSLDMRDSLGSIKSLTCATNYNIGSVSALDIIAQSEKSRFADLKYRIDFIPSGKTEPTTNAGGSLTIVNPSISAVTDETPVQPEAPATTTPVVTPATTTPSTTPVVTPKPVKPTTPTTPAKPTYTQEYTYGIPVSNPNGYTDLAARFLASGIIENKTFIATAVIDNDSTGAIQFEVKNIGTKTSNTWTYTAKLPNGETYTSPSQAALKPNERAVITLGFAMGDTTGVKRYDVEVSITPDSNQKNNQFETVVAVTD
jgi:hypothetical protein